MDRNQASQSKGASGLEGLRPIRTHRATVSRSTPDFRSCINGSARNKKSVAERGESSTGRATERPRVQLLAERMYEELEPKRRPMKAIARLMRLDGLWNAQKEKTRLSDNLDRQPSDENVGSSSGFVSHRRSSRWNMSSRPTKSDMARIRQKIDARNLSDYEISEGKIRASKELEGTSGKVDSRDLLLKYVRKRDALFEDQRFKPSSSRSASLLEPSSSAQSAGYARASRSEMNTGECDITSYPQRIDGLLLEPQFRHRAHTSHRIPNIQSEVRNMGSSNEVELPRPASSEVRKLAREITNQIRNASAEREDEIHTGSVSRDGGRRFVERWKITHKYQDLEIVGEDNRLDEMLAIPDEESLSSRGCPSNEIQRTSSRSRGAFHDVFVGENRLDHRGPTNCHRRKIAMGFAVRKVILSPLDSKSRRKKRLPCPPSIITESDSALDANARGPSEEQMAKEDEHTDNPVSNTMIDEQGHRSLSSKSSPLHQNNSSADNESSAAANDQEDFHLHQGLHLSEPEEGSLPSHHLEAGPVYPGRFDDAGHASPTSIVEVPFVEDAPLSSESFERVRHELNEAEMPLEILKMESPAYNDISTLITTEEGIPYPSSSWESSYMLDVLIQSGFDSFDFDMFKIMWRYPDSSLDPALFYDLEAKYSEETAGSTTERMLLFDRINSGIFQIFENQVDVRPWLVPKMAGHKDEAQDGVDKLMSMESDHWEFTQRILLRDLQWEDHREEVVSIGTEIEDLLIDDIITELLC